MDDYIDILLSALEEEMYSHLGKDYFLASQREDHGRRRPAGHAVRRSERPVRLPTNPPGTATASAYQDAYARRAFLLARAVYR